MKHLFDFVDAQMPLRATIFEFLLERLGENGWSDWIVPRLLRDGSTIVRRSFHRTMCPPHSFWALLKCLELAVAVDVMEDGTRKLLCLGPRVAMDVVVIRVVPSGSTEPVERLHGDICGDRESVEAVERALESMTCDPPAERQDERGSFFMLMKDDNEFRFRRLGRVKTAFVQDNYTQEVAREFAPLVAWLTSEDPQGRMAIFAGPPGTGKTYYLRGLMSETEGVSWIYVPPGMLGQLASPAMLSALVDFRSDYGGKNDPIVLVIEDADSLLVKRTHANVSDLSVLLNMSDGLLGTALNLRVIATCNQPIEEMDAAAIRAQRMFKKLDFVALPVEHAQSVFARIRKPASLHGFAAFVGKTVLSDIYAKAAKDEADLAGVVASASPDA